MNKNPENQFQPGNKFGGQGGRKGYEYEEKQRKQMELLLNRILKMARKIEKGKASEAEIERYKILSSVVLKIMDKFHANKTDIKLDFDKPLLIKKLK